MRARELLAGGVAAVGLVGLLVAISWPWRCPVDLKLLHVSPALMGDTCMQFVASRLFSLYTPSPVA